MKKQTNCYQCTHLVQTVEQFQEDAIRGIRSFYKKHGRIPVKREKQGLYASARRGFGTWNKAIEAAGFVPNPVMFAEGHKAHDGHTCDSLSEKIIDDWLSRRGISHETDVPYPSEPKLTCDFVVNGYFIEFFGLDGEHPRYTELAEKKRGIAKKHKLKLIELKPKHIFPKVRLNEILDFLQY